MIFLFLYHDFLVFITTKKLKKFSGINFVKEIMDGHKEKLPA